MKEKVKKPDTKEHDLYESIHLMLRYRLICGDRNQNRRKGLERRTRELSGMMEIVYILFWGSCYRKYTTVQK